MRGCLDASAYQQLAGRYLPLLSPTLHPSPLPPTLAPATELTLDEATAAAAAQRQHLQGQIDARTTELASILAHLRLVEQAIADLEQLRQQGMDQ